MGTKLEFSTFFIMDENGDYTPIADEIENFSDDIHYEGSEAQNDGVQPVYKEETVSITFNGYVLPRSGRRAISYNQVYDLLFSNNWLKMHGYPMVRSIPLRKGRTRSKKKNDKRGN